MCKFFDNMVKNLSENRVINVAGYFNRQSTKRLLSPLLAVVLFGLMPHQAQADGRIVKDGIKVDFSLKPMKNLKPVKGDKSANKVIANSDAFFSFNITDQSDNPVSGAYPAAWMQRRAESIPSSDATCKNMVKSFISGSILTQPTLNLNTYYVLVMNDDATLSVVDPLFHFGGTNLLTMVPLSSPGFDWQLADKPQRLFVSLPKTKRLAVVDTVSFKLLAELEVSGTPGVVALQPDQHYLWVAWVDEAGQQGGVDVFDTQTNKKVSHFELGAGTHHIAFAAGDKYAFVTHNNNVTVIDIAKLEPIKTIFTTQRPAKSSAIAYSAAADAIYITYPDEGTLISINASTLTVNNRIMLDKGIEHLRFAPNGRHAVVVNPLNDRVYIIDSLNDAVTKKGKVESGPDQVNFSDTVAYIRHRSSETVLMIPMEAIINKDVSLQVVDFPGGEGGFGLATTPAAGIIQAPGESAVLVAHPKDQQIYYYKEGMAAPMGSFQNFSRNARAVIAIDRSLQEHADGVYQTAARMAEAGTYDVAFFMDTPRVVHCFEVRVAPDLNKPVNPLRQIAAVLLPGQSFTPDKSTLLKFRLQDRLSGEPISGLTKLNMLTVLAPGIWKTRTEVKEIGQGVYTIDWQPPQSGAYYIQLYGDWKTLKMQAPGQIMLRVM